jgi:hypothetical protein
VMLRFVPEPEAAGNAAARGAEPPSEDRRDARNGSAA